MSSKGVELISQMRERQLQHTGEMPKLKNNVLSKSDLICAAIAYATVENYFSTKSENNNYPPVIFPYSREYWKPNRKNNLENLAKAGAYIAAEIDRILSETENNQN